jgi:hypothetical protein
MVSASASGTVGRTWTFVPGAGIDLITVDSGRLTHDFRTGSRLGMGRCKQSIDVLGGDR